MMHLGLRFKRLLLVLGDYAIFHLSLLLTLVVRYGGLTEHDWKSHALPFALLGGLWVLSFYVNGLYDLVLTRDQLRFFRAYLEGMLVNLLVGLAFFYTIPFGIAPRTNLFLHFAFALLLGYAWRMAYNRLIAPRLFRNRVLFVGRSDDAHRLHSLLKSSAQGFELVAVTQTAPGTRIDDGNVTWYADLKNIAAVLEQKQIQTIVLGHRPEEVPGLQEALYQTLFTTVALIDRARLEEMVTGRVPLEHVSQTWFLENLRESDKTWHESVKRVTDVVLAIPFGLVFCVMYPLVALGIKATSSGPVLYSQTRTGKYGKQFTIWKLRTMRADAEQAGKPQFAQKADPRITKIGGFLRATRIDELPQIWNVLRGDMSLIGPRPERPEFVEELTRQMPYYALRHLTRPGLTGWAQVRFPYAGTFEDNLKKLQYDLYYIRHRSVLLDLAILLKTIGIVVRRQGT